MNKSMELRLSDQPVRQAPTKTNFEQQTNEYEFDQQQFDIDAKTVDEGSIVHVDFNPEQTKQANKSMD